MATIAYALAEEDHVSIVVYHTLGRRVAVLVDGIQAAGKHAAVFNAKRLPSGLYIVRMVASSRRFDKAMLLAR